MSVVLDLHLALIFVGQHCYVFYQLLFYILNRYFVYEKKIQQTISKIGISQHEASDRSSSIEACIDY